MNTDKLVKVGAVGAVGFIALRSGLLHKIALKLRGGVKIPVE